MTSILVGQACRSYRSRITCFSRLQILRTIHSTAILQKKKRNFAGDDLFSEDSLVEEEELFKDSPTTFTARTTPSFATQSSEPSPSSSQTEETTAKAKKRHSLPPAMRLERLNKLLSFVEQRIGRRPAVEIPLVRKRSWLTMLDLAANEEEMKRIVELFPKHRESEWEFPDSFAEAFVRRCEELSCPQLSLTVFGNFAKYNLPLTLPSARWLIHSLSVRNPISEIFLAASFYPVYNLPSISEDLPSAAMLAAACLDKKNKTEETIKVAEALLPHIQRMWKEEGNSLGTTTGLERARVARWVVLALKRLNRALKKESRDVVSPEVLPRRIIIDGPSPVPRLNVQA